MAEISADCKAGVAGVSSGIACGPVTRTETETPWSRSGSVPVARQQRVQKAGSRSKIGCLESSDSINDVDQLAAPCKVEDADRADDREASRAGDRHRGTIVHQHQVRPQSERQCDGGGLAGVEPLGRLRVVCRGSRDRQPRRPVGCPVADGLRRVRMEQFIPDNRRHRHGRKQPGQQVKLVDENEIVQPTSVRDDDLHAYRPSWSRVCRSRSRSCWV